MPIRETGVVYVFPLSEEHRLQLIDLNRDIGKLWISTALVAGRMRMKFARLEHFKAEPVIDPDFNSPEPYVPAPKPMRKPAKRKTKKASHLLAYAGAEGRGAEWDA